MELDASCGLIDLGEDNVESAGTIVLDCLSFNLLSLAWLFPISYAYLIHIWCYGEVSQILLSQWA